MTHPIVDLESELAAARAELAHAQKRVERLEADARLIREREAQFRILSELVTDCCWVRWRSADGREERGWVNDAFTELTGYTPEEFEKIGRPGLVHPDDLERIAEFIDGPEGVSEHEFRIVRKDGEVRWLFERMSVVTDDDGGGRTVYGATRDVTAQKKARRVLVEHRDELERRVAARTAELVEAGQALEREVEERQQIAEALRHAKNEAEAASRAKGDFLATMTHELRTPLHGIVGLADLLLGMDLPRAARDRLLTLENSARSLQHLVQGVLDLSKIEAEQVVLETVAFSIRQLVDELGELLIDRVEARDNTLKCEVDRSVPLRVLGDPIRLRQVLLNLMDNAAKFTRNGTIELRIGSVDDGDADTGALRFSVRDSGIGLDAEAQRRIFDPFAQAQASTTRKYGGTGLGLAISSRLVELMGGRLQVESEPGEGSDFHFVVELPAAPRRAAGEATAALVAGGGRRLLVAEDNPVNQMVVRAQLETLGFTVDVVGDGQQALEALAQGGYEAWLLDCHMPVMDGFEAIRRWRASESGERLPVIAVTASALRDELDRCIEAGMDDLLTKPYRLQDLAAVLARRLATP
ncbi:MAG: ATP-binding protein [Acidobacteriota bacterium]